MADLRELPSVEHLLRSDRGSELIACYGRPLTLEAIRNTLDEVRARFPQDGVIPEGDALLLRAHALLSDWTAHTLQPVINATGVIVHTNLGRAPLSTAALQAMQDASAGYSNLEYDLVQGRRGSRSVHAEALLKRLTGAEAALVVNNNAAALLLILKALAAGRNVVIARSQLIEIGGGFRIPDVMQQSGATLLEVGTTNRVHLSDYEAALEEDVALFLRAHRSNFRIIGFTSEPALSEITALARRAGVLMADDLGSGTLLDTTSFGLGREPRVQESLNAGADLVCFSGDKLLGGPQAGIIVGRKDLVDRLKKHPLARAVRADKLCLAALSATLLHYVKDEAHQKVPVWRMISASPAHLKDRAAQWAQAIGQGEVVSGESTVGGGSLPEEVLHTWLLALTVSSPNALLERLRGFQPPIVARVLEDRVVLDPRTVLPEQENALLAGLQAALDGA